MESRTKFCKKCSCVKDADDFHKYTNICKLCKAQYNKDYYAKKNENKASTKSDELASEVCALTQKLEEMNFSDLKLELKKLSERVTKLEFENHTLKLEFENYKMNQELEKLRKEKN